MDQLASESSEMASGPVAHAAVCASDAAISVRGLRKKYSKTLRRGVYHMATELLRGSVGLPISEDLRKGEFWALDDINLEVKRGECLGVVGANGAGKSTLLKVLSGIIDPTAGDVVIRGRVGSLIEIGAGFHPDLSGRENIYVNGSILGLSKTEIDQSFDKIVAFAGIGDFLDTPVRFYSSGMYVRLGFAVAAHTRPDVLLVDEVLAVGDRAFRARCLSHFDTLLKAGCAVILVSHNMSLIHNQCARAILLERGRAVIAGPTSEVLDRYRSLGRDRGPTSSGAEVVNQDVSILDVSMLDAKGVPCSEFRTGDGVVIRIQFEARKAVESPVFNVGLLDADGNQITAWRSDAGVPLFEAGKGSISLGVDALNLLPGAYRLSVRLWKERVLGEMYCSWEDRPGFQILGGFDSVGYCYLPHQWEPVKRDSTATAHEDPASE